MTFVHEKKTGKKVSEKYLDLKIRTRHYFTFYSYVLFPADLAAVQLVFVTCQKGSRFSPTCIWLLLIFTALSEEGRRRVVVAVIIRGEKEKNPSIGHGRRRCMAGSWWWHVISSLFFTQQKAQKIPMNTSTTQFEREQRKKTNKIKLFF